MTTAKTKKNKNPHDGSTLDDFLREEGIFEETEAAALKRALALNVADLMRKKRMRKARMAKQMHTSRAALDRLLDPTNTSVTLATITRAAKALGRKIKIDLVPV
jgi:predicted XRE-type DNA-binding protein